MNANARNARRIVRDRSRQARAERAARRAVAADPIQSVRTHLVARGLDVRLADRFASAVSRKAGQGTAVGRITKKVPGKGRAVRTYDVKLFSAAQMDTVLAAYRPAKDRAAQRAFLALAA
ncbi:hypothetical protein [Streptomyces sp. NPDC049879]|uniref:hypothetical protein n=1 Tax=Streptomyces sp. NPDC049879 TaxID=3365598 RepID=UPI0037AA60C3